MFPAKSIIVKGSANVVKQDFATQWESALATIKAGAALGEMSLFDGEPRSAMERSEIRESERRDPAFCCASCGLRDCLAP
jgi:hypothetical protein